MGNGLVSAQTHCIFTKVGARMLLVKVTGAGGRVEKGRLTGNNPVPNSVLDEFRRVFEPQISHYSILVEGDCSG
jgi:hypothetical protein